MAIGRIPEPGTGIPESIVDAKGDIVTATAADTPARLAVGTNDYRLVAASGEATGLKYVADTQNTVADAKGDLLVGTGADTIARLAVGTNGHTLVADSAETTGLKWQAPGGAAGMTLITRQTITNSSGTNIDSVFTSTYRSYYIIVENVVSASSQSNSDFQLQLRYGSTTQAGNYKFQEVPFGINYSATERNTSQLLLSLDIGDSSQNNSCWIQLTRVGNSSERPYWWAQSHNAYNGIPLITPGYLNEPNTYTGVRFIVSAGTFDATVAIYGLAKS